MTSLAPAVEAYATAVFDNEIHKSDYGSYIHPLLIELEWKGDVKALRDALPSNMNKICFTEFLNIMSFLGYPPKVVKTTMNHIKPDMVPCLFIDQKDLQKVRGTMVYEPTDNKTKGTAYIFKEHLGEYDIIPDQTISASGWSWFTKLLFRFNGIFAQVLIASFVISLLALVTPLFMMSIYDRVIGAHSPEMLKYLLAGVVLAIGIEYALRFLRARSLTWFGARIDNIVSNAILERILSLPATFTEGASVAAQLARLKAFESVREFFTGQFFLSFIEFPFVLILVAAIAIIAPTLVVIPLVIILLYGIMLVATRSRLKALTARLATTSIERENMNIETIGKQETLRSSGGFDAWLRRYEKVSAEASFAGYRYNKAISKIDTITQEMVMLGGVAMIYFGVSAIWAGNMTTGSMIAVLILTWRILSPLQMICIMLPRLDQVKRNIEQINRLMDVTPERAVTGVKRELPEFKGQIEFNNVGLRYSKDADPVYAGLSFKIEPGKLIAITGTNSAGKSTTLKLISGLYHPQAGSIRVDGTDIRQIDPQKLRQSIAYVGQQPEFFTETLRNNFLFVKPEASDEAIIYSLEEAGLSVWFKSLERGLDSTIGEGADDVVPSGFETQLALARAFLQDSKVMLFDELPYEFLNSEIGQNYYDYLSKQRGKKTIFYVSYRQDYIALADIVIELTQELRPQIREGKRGKGA